MLAEGDYDEATDECGGGIGVVGGPGVGLRCGSAHAQFVERADGVAVARERRSDVGVCGHRRWGVALGRSGGCGAEEDGRGVKDL